MELRHLRYFVTIAEELSFTRAAEKLRLAQPSLTRQIKNLESELKVQLFSRNTRRISLTEQGQFFSSAPSGCLPNPPWTYKTCANAEWALAGVR